MRGRTTHAHNKISMCTLSPLAWQFSKQPIAAQCCWRGRGRTMLKMLENTIFSEHHVPNNSTFGERYFSVYLYYFVKIFVCFPSVLSSFVISVLLLEAATLMIAAELAGLVIATGLDHIHQSMYICVY